MRALATVERLDPEAAARMTEFTPGTVPRIHQVAERAYFVGELCAFLAERVEGLTREVERVEELTRRVEALEEATKKRPRGRPPKDAEGS